MAASGEARVMAASGEAKVMAASGEARVMTAASTLQMTLEDTSSDGADHVFVQTSEQINTQAPAHVNVQISDHVNVQEPDQVNVQTSDWVNAQKPDQVNVQTSDWVNVQEPDQVNVQTSDWVNVQEPDQVNVQTSDWVNVQKPDQVNVQTSDWVNVQEPDQVNVQTSDWVNVQKPDQVNVQTSDNVNVKAPEHANMPASDLVNGHILDYVTMKAPDHITVQAPDLINVNTHPNNHVPDHVQKSVEPKLAANTSIILNYSHQLPEAKAEVPFEREIPASSLNLNDNNEHQASSGNENADQQTGPQRGTRQTSNRPGNGRPPVVDYGVPDDIADFEEFDMFHANVAIEFLGQNIPVVVDPQPAPSDAQVHAHRAFDQHTVMIIDNNLRQETVTTTAVEEMLPQNSASGYRIVGAHGQNETGAVISESDTAAGASVYGISLSTRLTDDHCFQNNVHVPFDCCNQDLGFSDEDPLPSPIEVKPNEDRLMYSLGGLADSCSLSLHSSEASRSEHGHQFVTYDDTTAESLETTSTIMNGKEQTTAEAVQDNVIDSSTAKIRDEKLSEPPFQHEITPPTARLLLATHKSVIKEQTKPDSLQNTHSSNRSTTSSCESVNCAEDVLISAENDFTNLESNDSVGTHVVSKQRTDADADALLDQIISGVNDSKLGPNRAAVDPTSYSGENSGVENDPLCVSESEPDSSFTRETDTDFLADCSENSTTRCYFSPHEAVCIHKYENKFSLVSNYNQLQVGLDLSSPVAQRYCDESSLRSPSKNFSNNLSEHNTEVNILQQNIRVNHSEESVRVERLETNLHAMFKLSDPITGSDQSEQNTLTITRNPLEQNTLTNAQISIEQNTLYNTQNPSEQSTLINAENNSERNKLANSQHPSEQNILTNEQDPSEQNTPSNAQDPTELNTLINAQEQWYHTPSIAPRAIEETGRILVDKDLIETISNKISTSSKVTTDQKIKSSQLVVSVLESQPVLVVGSVNTSRTSTPEGATAVGVLVKPDCVSTDRLNTLDQRSNCELRASLIDTGRHIVDCQDNDGNMKENRSTGFDKDEYQNIDYSKEECPNINYHQAECLNSDHNKANYLVNDYHKDCWYTDYYSEEREYNDRKGEKSLDTDQYKEEEEEYQSNYFHKEYKSNDFHKEESQNNDYHKEKSQNNHQYKDECPNSDYHKEECGDADYLKEECGENDYLKEECGETDYLKEECGETDYLKEECGDIDFLKDEYRDIDYLKEECGDTNYLKEECGETDYLKEECGDIDLLKDECRDIDYLKEECGDTNYLKEECGETDYFKEECGETDYFKEECGDIDFLKDECRDIDYLNEECGETDYLKEEYGDTNYLKEECGDTDYFKEECGDIDFLKDEYRDIDYLKEECGDADYLKEECRETDYHKEECGETDYLKEEYGDTNYLKEECGETDYHKEACGETDYHKEECGDTDYHKEECGDTDYHKEECGDTDYLREKFGDTNYLKEECGDTNYLKGECGDTDFLKEEYQNDNPKNEKFRDLNHTKCVYLTKKEAVDKCNYSVKYTNTDSHSIKSPENRSLKEEYPNSDHHKENYLSHNVERTRTDNTMKFLSLHAPALSSQPYNMAMSSQKTSETHALQSTSRSSAPHYQDHACHTHAEPKIALSPKPPSRHLDSELNSFRQQQHVRRLGKNKTITTQTRPTNRTEKRINSNSNLKIINMENQAVVKLNLHKAHNSGSSLNKQKPDHFENSTGKKEYQRNSVAKGKQGSVVHKLTPTLPKEFTRLKKLNVLPQNELSDFHITSHVDCRSPETTIKETSAAAIEDAQKVAGCGTPLANGACFPSSSVSEHNTEITGQRMRAGAFVVPSTAAAEKFLKSSRKTMREKVNQTPVLTKTASICQSEGAGFGLSSRLLNVGRESVIKPNSEAALSQGQRVEAHKAKPGSRPTHCKMMTMQEFERIQKDKQQLEACARISSSKACVDCHLDSKYRDNQGLSSKRRRERVNYNCLVALENIKFLEMLRYKKSAYQKLNFKADSQTFEHRPGPTACGILDR